MQAIAMYCIMDKQIVWLMKTLSHSGKSIDPNFIPNRCFYWLIKLNLFIWEHIRFYPLVWFQKYKNNYKMLPYNIWLLLVIEKKQNDKAYLPSVGLDFILLVLCIYFYRIFQCVMFVS